MLDSFFGHFRHFLRWTQKPPNLYYPTLSHELIKILDEEMDRLRNICYMLYMKKGNIGHQENCIRSSMRPGVSAVKDVE